MPKVITTEVEVLPKESQIDKQLSAITLHIQNELNEYESLEQKAVWRALRIGLLLLKAKEVVPHGGFQDWIKITFQDRSYRRCAQFMQLADSFLRSKKIKLLEASTVCETDNLGSKPHPDLIGKLPKPVQLAFDFIGDDTLNNLLKKYRIESPRGGHHPRLDGQPPMRIEYNADLAAADFKEINMRLAEHVLCKKHWSFLRHQDLLEFNEMLIASQKAIKPSIDKIRTVNKH